MSRPVAVIAVMILLAAIGAAVWTSRNSDHSLGLPTIVITPANAKHFETREQEAAGLCPWRNIHTDMARFFPGSDTVVDTNLVVSSERIAITKRLGRTPTGDENALRVYRIKRGKSSCGTVIARRVRGEYGLIELVLAVDAGSDVVKYARIQRLREPEPAASALQSEVWLRQFQGLSGDSNWQSVAHAALLPAQARTSAEAITDAARTALILLSTAQSLRVAVPQ
jgi:hypothetical protein